MYNKTLFGAGDGHLLSRAGHGSGRLVGEGGDRSGFVSTGCWTNGRLCWHAAKSWQNSGGQSPAAWNIPSRCGSAWEDALHHFFPTVISPSRLVCACVHYNADLRVFNFTRLKLKLAPSPFYTVAQFTFHNVQMVRTTTWKWTKFQHKSGAVRPAAHIRLWIGLHENI